MKSLIVFALLALSSCFAQTLPDTPSATPAYLKGDTQVVNAYDKDNTLTVKTHNHYSLRLLALVGADVFEQAANYYDVTETEKGIKAGVAVEASCCIGRKPEAHKFYVKDGITLGLIDLPSLFAYKYHSTSWFYGGLVGPIVYGVKHIHGGDEWKELLHGQNPPCIYNEGGCV
jgi:hypothetical protein